MKHTLILELKHDIAIIEATDDLKKADRYLAALISNARILREKLKGE